MNWIAILCVFLLLYVKFLVTATIALATFAELSVQEIFIASIGALSCLIYFILFLIKFILVKKKDFKKKEIKNFKKRNRILIMMKQSKLVYFGLSLQYFFLFQLVQL